VYLPGSAGNNSGTVIATVGTHQSTYGGGILDAVLVKFNTSGVRQWATYYGGVGDDEGSTCRVDASGNIYLSGISSASSPSSIATVGSHQPSQGGGTYDAFLVKFNASCVRQWGTYYGGTANEEFTSCTLAPSGNVYLSGRTSSTNGTVIATAGSHQSTHGGGLWDGYLACFNASGVRQWGTYYGGTGGDEGYDCATDGFGGVYLVGLSVGSSTGTAMASLGSYQPGYGGGFSDAFLVKFLDCAITPPPSQPSVISGPTIICSGLSATYSVTNDPLASSYIWYLPNGWSGSSSTNSISTIAGSSGIFTVIANNVCGYSSPEQTLNVTVNATPTLAIYSSNPVLCIGQTATITATGAGSYTFNPGGPVTSIVVSPTITTIYTILGDNANGCTSSTTFTQIVSTCAGLVSVPLVDEEFKLFPNPTSGKINVTGISGKEKVEIYNSIGLLIYSGIIENSEIDLSRESSGIYFIRLESEIRKVFKE
jgi:hypothetical protein